VRIPVRGVLAQIAFVQAQVIEAAAAYWPAKPKANPTMARTCLGQKKRRGHGRLPDCPDWTRPYPIQQKAQGRLVPFRDAKFRIRTAILGGDTIL